MHQLGEDGRLDLYVYNEATAWTLSSQRLIVDAPLADDEPWDGAVADGRMMAMMLYQDDAFHVRVVLGDLTEEEEESWVGRASWWLRVPDGVLVVAAGGEFVWGWAEEYEDYGEFVHPVAVPPGDYRVDVLTTLTGVNGLPAWERADADEALGAWWRRTRPDEEMPAWMKFLLLEGLAEDPGHEQEWVDWSRARHVAVMDAVESGAWIDWIVRLRPLDGDPPSELPELDEGCFMEPEIRLPKACPRGLVGNPVNGEELYEPEPVEPVDVLERLEDRPLAQIEGGPVEWAAADLEVAARLAWFANKDADGEVLLEADELGYWVEEHIPPDDVFVRTAPDGRFRVGFPETQAVYDLLLRLRRLAGAFGALPEGTSLELVTSADGEGPQGDLRFAGTVSDGVWRIDRTHPPVSAETLSGALALAAECDGDTVQARDEDELARLQERWREDGMQRIATLQVDGLEVGHQEGTRFTFAVAAALFAVRYGDIWPCPEPDDPLADFDDFDVDEDDDLFGSLAEHDFALEDAFLEAPSGRDYFDVTGEALPSNVRERTDEMLTEFEEAGAVAVGDLVCSLSPSILIRGGADKGARYFTTVMVAPFVGAVIEAYSRFADGSSLTTTTNSFVGGATPESGIRWNPVPERTSPAELVGAHLEAVEAHAASRDTEVVLIRQNLMSLAEAIEEFLVRRMGG